MSCGRACNGTFARRHDTGQAGGTETALLQHLHADATLAELRLWLLETRHVPVSVGCLSITLLAIGADQGPRPQRDRTLVSG